MILIAVAFSSCSTAYKTGQTPDDVYYSPLRAVEDDQNRNNRYDDHPQVDSRRIEDWQVRMAARDRRWRDIDNYSYNNSPYNYCYCNCNYTGYYYNPYFYPSPIYNIKINTVKPNNTPRTVNLAAYHNYNPYVATNVKTTTGTGLTRYTSSSSYNNNNNSTNNKGLGNRVRKILLPRSNSSSNTDMPSANNDTRSYTPSSSTTTSSNSSSSSSSSSGSNTRPARGN